MWVMVYVGEDRGNVSWIDSEENKAEKSQVAKDGIVYFQNETMNGCN